MKSSTPGMTARCKALIDTLELPRPFDTERFLAGLVTRTGREITLLPGRLPTDQTFGMLISTPENDYIVCAEGLHPLQFRHTVMHEVGHLLLRHTATPGGEQTWPTTSDDALRLLFPTLSPELVRRALTRGMYVSAHEHEAELFASLVLSRVHSTRTSPVGTRTATAAATPRRLRAANTNRASRDRAVHRRMRQAARLLTPLWLRLVAEVPQVRLEGVDKGALSRDERAEFRLYRRILEIRDAQFLLRPSVPPEMAARTGAIVAGRAPGSATVPEAVDLLAEARRLTRADTALRGDPDDTRNTR